MNKYALITGAGSGIGRDAALGLQKEGFTVALAGRTLATLQETRDLMEDPDQATCLVVDVAKPASVQNGFAQLLQTFGRLDLLFNNAGIGAAVVPFEELTDQQWQDVIDINLNGSFYCARAAFALMKSQNPQGGRIINNGSISAHVPRPYSAPYTATKHAITGLTRSISLDGRAFGIACSQIDIGNALTNMAEKMTQGVPQADGSTAIEATMPVKHVTDAIIYLANLPNSVNVPFMTVMANQMPYIGRG